MHSVSLDHPSPKPHKKLHHPFKTTKKSNSTLSSNSNASSQHQSNITPPDSPTAPGRKFK